MAMLEQAVPAAARSQRRDPVRSLIWNLEVGGCSEREAGNLVALLRGLRPAASGWSEREIDHLCFLRSLVETGRLGS
ncbi:MAG TPA: hypothetical protein VFP19_10180 [Candidatus Limnocylindrales bacterium]|nr:hypothetical protein [Candidatus Limnocylindrales bacterium]